MKGTIIGVALAALCASCALDTDEDMPQQVETAQAVSSFGIWYWGCGGSTPCALDLGPAAGETCFLAGVYGNLQHAGLYTQVEVVRSGGRWGLQVVPNGHPIGGAAVCIPGTTVATAQWHNGQAELDIASGATRRCFLSGIRNTNGFTATTDFVQVRQVGGHWFLGGNMPSTKDTWAFASCVDVPTAAADDSVSASTGAAANHVPIQSNNPGGWACGVKKLQGRFATDDYNDGVWIEYNNGISEWQVNVINGKAAVTSCVK
jgi:hypothetical protein